ncbi:hypothetical protein PRIPAC_86819 [Pristionchus pacificus]|uniref:Uncharacterized protein n=1 Tax=Pristionchus pacificus TaxID=54126 RepID=A0A2A6BKS9_PRIPA|nr:hypothetical protein PRIPAC_86819 [Pristionchus pacificus]|eukprot:PDM66524.1 hypothetical protein PRIPAC_47941 [Pristionchus pacificus]
MADQQGQESSGKLLRQEFWQVMWLPLTLYLIAGYDMELGYALYSAIEITCICFWHFCERNDAFDKWLYCVLPYSTAVVVLGPVGRFAINRVCFGGEKVVEEWLEEAGKNL